ncbi:hydroxyacid dehydrogenase [Pseudonocardia eucalypti]|uniref:Hydroxyacid dehydrogenase n=1 Tax=Pseudonocardia eucalypti TaxID=648755 RepID=A0ABP9QJF6_9PSEU|nr:phosphoglycerate dehydrogenase-like enzyme [Pseudonocardia eucalypti]
MSELADEHPLVIGLGAVDPALVTGVLGDDIDFVARPSGDEIARAAGAIVRADVEVDRAFFDRASRLRVLARTGVGVDHVDVGAATERGIAVVITPGSGTRAVAEGVIAMALHLVKRLSANTALVREGRWAERADPGVLPGDLDAATIGIIGYGRIGRRVGELATAFGMRVLAHDPLNPPDDRELGADLDELVAASDVVTLHVPLTTATRHLADAALIARMRPGAILINCGRGGLLDLDAAHGALRAGRLGGLGLDTFDPEPAVHHPVFDEPNVVLTPHTVGLSRRGTALTFADAAQGVVDVLAGRVPAAVADPHWTDAAVRVSTKEIHA